MKEKNKSKIDIAWELFREDKVEDTLKLCKTLRNIRKYALDANYILAAISYNNKEFTDALTYFKNALEYDTERKAGGTIYYWIGRTYDYNELWSKEKNPIHDSAKAKQAYIEAIRFDNYPSDAIFKVASDTKSDVEKIRLYELGIEKFPEEVNFYVFLANLYKRMGYPTKQLKTLENALNRKIKSSSLYFNIGAFYYDQKDYITSLKYFVECQQINKNDRAISIICYCIGNCHFELKKYKNAISSYRKGFEADKNDSSIWYNILGLIISYHKEKRDEEIAKLMNSIPNDKDLFQFIDFEFPLMAYLDGQQMEDVDFQQKPKELLPLIKTVSGNAKDSFLLLKTGLLLSELHNYEKDHVANLKCLKSLLPYPIGYDFIESKIASAYSNIIATSKHLKEAFESFIDDLNNGNLSSNSTEQIAEELIKELYKSKQYDKVVSICQKLYDEQIENIRAMFKYAYSLDAVGNWKEAKNCYEKYLQKYPKDSSALNNLGVIYKAQGDLQKAISLYKEAIKHNNETELYHNNLKVAITELDKKKLNEKKDKIPSNWINSIKSINVQQLDEIGYFDIIAKIEKINKKYKNLVERDFKEFTFNYLVSNHKSTVVLAGSIVEMVLTYYCEKKKINNLQLKDSKGSSYNKKLYDCVLNDLINYIGDKNLFGNDFHHLGNLARVYRNLIHPGLELKTKTDIKPKADLCFFSTIEILKKILS